MGSTEYYKKGDFIIWARQPIFVGEHWPSRSDGRIKKQRDFQWGILLKKDSLDDGEG
jgi:hypothetical protein